MKNIGIAVHGGAGTILRSSMTPEKEKLYKEALKEAILEGWNLMNSGKTAVDAVEKSVEILENNSLFNAGKGSVFTNDGKHEMDASIMDGKTLNAGCVSSVRNIRNPVLLARKILDNSDFVYLNGKGAEEFALLHNLKFEEDDYFYDEYRYSQYLKALVSDKVILDHSEDDVIKKFGTVGAVALDSNGNLAAATSTGGMTNKKYGRIGDSPIIGSGTYANNSTCAVSCTGNGEYFIRSVTAYDVSALMEYRKLSLEESCQIAVNEKLIAINGEGGLIAIDKNNNISLTFNSEGMYRAFTKNGREVISEIYK
ncbi:MAG TPA: isoaspartyl peptidase/L-asparaginase [Ignavibacteria bacterium]|nr:isoaspartyl peptidase/L-asparaginase [Ignavibacteria bacterium]